MHAHTHRVKGEETHPRTDKEDSSLILQGLTSHQRTSPEEHMFSAEFGGLYDNGFRNAAETKIPEG